MVKMKEKLQKMNWSNKKSIEETNVKKNMNNKQLVLNDNTLDFFLLLK